MVPKMPNHPLNAYAFRFPDLAPDLPDLRDNVRACKCLNVQDNRGFPGPPDLDPYNLAASRAFPDVGAIRRADKIPAWVVGRKHVEAEIAGAGGRRRCVRKLYSELRRVR